MILNIAIISYFSWWKFYIQTTIIAFLAFIGRILLSSFVFRFSVVTTAACTEHVACYIIVKDTTGFLAVPVLRNPTNSELLGSHPQMTAIQICLAQEIHADLFKLLALTFLFNKKSCNLSCFQSHGMVFLSLSLWPGRALSTIYFPGLSSAAHFRAAKAPVRGRSVFLLFQVLLCLALQRSWENAFSPLQSAFPVLLCPTLQNVKRQDVPLCEARQAAVPAAKWCLSSVRYLPRWLARGSLHPSLQACSLRVSSSTREQPTTLELPWFDSTVLFATFFGFIVFSFTHYTRLIRRWNKIHPSNPLCILHSKGRNKEHYCL